MRAERGSISVFLALISLLLFGLFCTLLEGARTACLRYAAEQALGSAMQSVFAAFDGDAAEQYGLLMRDTAAEDWTDAAEYYLRKYLEPTAGLFSAEGDRIGLSGLELVPGEVLALTDDNGAVFADAVLSYMESGGLSVLLQELLMRLGIYDADGAASFSETIRRLTGSEANDFGSLLKNYEKLKDDAEAYKSMLPEKPEGETEENPEQPQESAASAKEARAFLDTLKSIGEKGPLAPVFGTAELSGLSWEAAGLPSSLSAAEKSANSGSADADFSLDEVFLLGEFAAAKMSRYTNPLAGGHQYELEYVLSGKSSEADVMKDVAGKLLLLRSGLNLLYLLEDAQKQAEAESAALVLAIALGAPYLEQAAKWLLLAGWALAEGMSDVKILLAGGAVPLWKSAGSWRLGLFRFAGDVIPAGSAGLRYIDYLRLLFYAGNHREQAYRMMDVLQMRLRSIHPDFELRQCIVKAELEMTAVFAPLYLVLPAQRLLMQGKQGWSYKKQAEFGYR